MRSLWIKLLSGVLVVTGLGAGWAILAFQQFRQAALPVGVAGLEIEIPEGASLGRVTSDLHRRGVLPQPVFFKILARLTGTSRKIQAGEYRLTPGTTPDSLLDMLASGKVIQYPFTIIEGWNFRQLVAALAEAPKINHRLQGKTQAQIVTELGIVERHPEGLFLPDTYHYTAGTTDVELLLRAKRAMDELLAREWPRRDQSLPLKSPYEALILASIVEKETAVPDERRRIAGVFIRRLQKRMRLQTDPTVIYGMGEAYQGNIRRKDLSTPTPYNTYVIKGLPPTPIAMPGAEAIRAVLHPAPGKELYFVARGDGSHHFSETLSEHNRAVRQFQLKRK